MIDPFVISVISAATALVASITGPLVTFSIGRAQIRAAVLSSNRQKWIDGFRELIAGFCSQLAVLVQVRDKVVKDGKIVLSTDPEVLRHFEQLVLTLIKIQLMINPLDDEHRQLLSVMEDLLTKVRTTAPSVDIQPEAEATARRIVELSLTILRREWMRVQRGS